MQIKQFFYKNRVPKFFILIMIFICWCTAFTKVLSQQTDQNQFVSAFQTDNSETIKLASVPNNLNQDSADFYLKTILERIDTDATVYSSYSGSDYSDFYCYSPAMEEQLGLTTNTSNGCNLQIVFTWDKEGNCENVYLGMPYIEYDF